MTGHSTRLLLALGLLLAILATAAAYWPGLDGPLVLDDFSNLKPVEAVDRGFWREAVFTNESGPLGRPLAMLTFALNRFATGGDVAAMKATNLALHLLGGLLVFWLAERLLRETPLQRRRAAALWIAAVWLLAPLFASTVLYVVQRMAQLAALAMLGGLLSYVAGRQMVERRPRHAALLIGSTFVFWTPLAILGKENGALLPLLVGTVEAFFFRLRGPANARRYLIGIYALFLALPTLGALVHYVPKLLNFSGPVTGRSFTRLERVLTESRILFDYAAQLFAPQPARLGVHHDDYVLSSGLLQPPSTLAAVAGLLLALAGVLFSAVRGVGRPLLFGVAFFLAGHALESTFFMLEPYFEHRNYLPSFGLLFTAAYVLFRLMDRYERLRPLLAAAAVAVPVAYASMTYGQAQVWSSLGGVLGNAVTQHPGSLRAHTDIAVYYARRGAVELAHRHAAEARALAGGNALSQALLPVILHCTAGSTPPPSYYAETLRKDLAGVPDRDFGHYLEVIADMAVAGQCAGIDLRAFAAELDRAVSEKRIDMSRVGWKHRAWIGKIQAEAGDFDRALAYAEEAMALEPGAPVPALMALHYQIKQGDIEGVRSRLDSIEERFGDKGGSVAGNIAFYRRLLDRTQAE